MTATTPTTATRRELTGWYLYDWANSAFITTVVTVFLGPFLTAITERAAGCEDCHVRPLGIPIPAGSYYPYLVSLSALLMVVVLPIVGAVADRTAHKKRLLGAFAYLGAAATIAMAAVTGDRYLLGGTLFLIANLAYGASVVVYYSFLPQLAGPDDRDRVSSVGWAIGYLGGGLLLVLNLIALQVVFDDAETAARLSIVSAGIWWALFTLLPMLWLQDRPPVGHVTGATTLTRGFRQLAHTLRNMRAYPLTLLFLAAYLIYNDGIQTVIALASQFGSQELELSQDVLVLTVLIVQFLAFGGALLLGAIAHRIGAWKTILGSLILWTGVIIAAFWLPVGQAAPFMLLGAVIGLVLGGSQALSRSLFSQMIPPGREAEYFSFYEISDKGTSWIGPLLFGLIFQLTSSYRAGIVSLLVFFIAGFALLLAVPVRRAIIAAGNQPPRVL